MTKTLRYKLESIGLWLAFMIFRILPPSWASATGGFLARDIAPRLAGSRKALRNITVSLTKSDENAGREILKDMWDNLGRTFAEYPHLKTLSSETYTEVIGAENIPADGSCIIFGGHIGNWEIKPAVTANRMDKDVSVVYRAPNNPDADRLLDACRKKAGNIQTLAKSVSGMRNLIKDIKGDRTIGILIDQKYNEGIAVPFFDRPAMTSPAFVELAQKFDIPLIPARVERIKDCNFRLTYYPAIETKNRDASDVMTDAHTMMEDWIRERPGQWLWLHRRWIEK